MIVLIGIAIWLALGLIGSILALNFLCNIYFHSKATIKSLLAVIILIPLGPLSFYPLRDIIKTLKNKKKALKALFTFKWF